MNNSQQEKYQRVCERFHYVEGKIQRRDDARLATEKTILSTLEKLQVGLTKLDFSNKKNAEDHKVLSDRVESWISGETNFKESMKRYFQGRVELSVIIKLLYMSLLYFSFDFIPCSYFESSFWPSVKVEAQRVKQRKNQLIDIFQSLDMEEEVLVLGGDETTNLAEVAAAYKKQAKQQSEELEAVQFCQICVERYDNNSRPRVVLSQCRYELPCTEVTKRLFWNHYFSHVLCNNCAENIIKSSPFAVSGTGACPTCAKHYSRHEIVKVIL